MTKEASNARQVIRDIRNNYGVLDDGTQAESFSFIAGNLKNAIEQLSTGLYEKEVHFILELIQNAEDNKYSDNTPDLRFVILEDDPTNTPNSDGCLCVFNNEVGFEEKNVKSVCQIGDSTKSKNEGYIGEKGIGFKSVFIVSTSPHIYSNGYHFKFKENDNEIKLSYVVPYWLDTTPEIVRNDNSNTAILLPLKQSKKSEIINGLKGIKPETILFLSKLEGLSIDINSECKKVDILRDKTNYPIVDLMLKEYGQEDKIKHFWLHSETMIVPSKIIEEKRKDIVDRKLTIAFQLDEVNYDGTMFAYLPTEVDSGLPFLINADFILTANRESIQSNRAWNIWIRDMLSDLIVNGLIEISKDKNYRQSLYGFIPLINDIKSLPEYFTPVCNDVYTKLSHLEIILKDDGSFVLPSASRLASKEIRNLFGGDLRPKALSEVFFVEQKLEKHAKQLNKIGVSSFLVEDFKKCLEDDAWLLTNNSNWFFDLYDFLHKSANIKINELKDFKIIPLQDGGRVSINEKQVYFLTDEQFVNDISKRLFSNGLPNVSFVDNKLFHHLSNNKELLVWVKDNVEILDFSISTYITGMLAPWLYENVSHINESNLMSAVQLILEYWGELHDEDKKIIGEKLPILLDTGLIKCHDELEGEEVLLPRLFDKNKGWQLILKNEDDCRHQDVLSDKYITLFQNENNYERLTEFFNITNAEEYPNFRTFKGNATYFNNTLYQEYVSSVIEDFNEEYTKNPEIISWMTPSFFHDETKRKNKKNISALLYWLEGMLEGMLGSLRYGEIVWFYRTYKSLKISSGLYFYLTNIPWISTTQGLKKPDEVFVRSSQIDEMFKDSLAYLKDDISPALCEFLGIKTEVTTKTVIDYLKVLSTHKEADIKLVRKLYKYLDDYGDEFQSNFENYALIFIPDSEKYWYKSDEVIWDDTSDVLGKLYGWLSPVYESSNLKQFFLHKINVSEIVQDEDLAKAWLKLPKRTDLNSKEIEASLSKIFPRLLIESNLSDIHSDWWDEFIEDAMVWTQDEEFENPNEVYVPDDYYLRNLFHDNLSFVWKPENIPHATLQVLYNKLGISLLSESIVSTLDNPGKVKELETAVFLTEHSKLLICYMLYNDSPIRYEELFNSNVLKCFLQSIETETDLLAIRYSIADKWVNSTVTDKQAFWDQSHHILYFRNGNERDDILDDVAEVIARALWGTFYKKYEDRVRMALAISNEERFRKVRDKKGWNLPPNIRREAIKLISESGQLLLEDEIAITNESDSKPESKEKIPSKSGDGEINSDDTLGKQTIQDSRNERGQDSPELHHGQRSHIGQSTSANSRSRVSSNRSRAGKSRSQGIASSVNQARRDQMHSYVANKLDDDLDNELDEDARKKAQEARDELGMQGELEVVDDLRAKGYEVTRMPENNKGYDIEAINPETSEIYYIEVKGDSFSWSDKGVGITPSQYLFGLEKSSSYYLAVVDNLRSSPRSIYYIQDPVTHITQYRFDKGWIGISTPIKTVSSIESGAKKSTVELLCEQTDSEKCKELIKYCDQQGYPYPDIGIELIDDAGAVIFENVELAWEHESIGVLLSEEEIDDAISIDGRWSFHIADDFNEITQHLDSVFNKDVKCE